MYSERNKIVSLVLKFDKTKGFIHKDLNFLTLVSTVTLGVLEFAILLNLQDLHPPKSLMMVDSRHVYFNSSLSFISFFQMQLSEEEFFLKKLSNQVGSFDLSNMINVSDKPNELQVSTDFIIFNTYYELVDFLKKYEVYDGVAQKGGGYIYYGTSDLGTKT